jgi:hypothetical protein
MTEIRLKAQGTMRKAQDESLGHRVKDVRHKA